MAADREGPAGKFKRALTSAMKTLADETELVVTFGAETPSLAAKRVRLPQVGHDLPADEIAVTRGLADSFALRLANHDDGMHNRYRPQGKLARAVFEAVEQARVEAIGANVMPGVAHNLTVHAGRPLRKKEAGAGHRAKGCTA